MTFVILLIFILEKRYEIQMNDTETKNHSGKSAGTDVHAACDSTGCAGSV